MRDPVVTCDGHAYERHAIKQWLRTHETSPATGLQLLHPGLVRVHALRCAVADYYSQQQQPPPPPPLPPCAATAGGGAPPGATGISAGRDSGDGDAGTGGSGGATDSKRQDGLHPAAVDMTSQAVKTSVVFLDGRWQGRSELRRRRKRREAAAGLRQEGYLRGRREEAEHRRRGRELCCLMCSFVACLVCVSGLGLGCLVIGRRHLHGHRLPGLPRERVEL
jgi:hypothetical protein